MTIYNIGKQSSDSTSSKNKMKAFIMFLLTTNNVYTSKLKLTNIEIINKFSNNSTTPIVIYYPTITNINDFSKYLLEDNYNKKHVYYYCNTYNIVFMFYDIQHFAFEIAASTYFLCLVLYDTKYFYISSNSTDSILNIISTEYTTFNSLNKIIFKDNCLKNNKRASITTYLRNFIMSGLWISNVKINVNMHFDFTIKKYNIIYKDDFKFIYNNITQYITFEYLKANLSGQTTTFKLINYLYKLNMLNDYASIYNIENMLKVSNISRSSTIANKYLSTYVKNDIRKLKCFLMKSLKIEYVDYILPIKIVDLYKSSNILINNNEIDEIKKNEFQTIKHDLIDPKMVADKLVNYQLINSKIIAEKILNLSNPNRKISNNVINPHIHNINNILSNLTILNKTSIGFLPQVESKDYLPQVESKDYLPQVESKDYLPQVESKDYLPQVESKDYLPNIYDSNYINKLPNDLNCCFQKYYLSSIPHIYKNNNNNNNIMQYICNQIQNPFLKHHSNKNNNKKRNTSELYNNIYKKQKID